MATGSSATPTASRSFLRARFPEVLAAGRARAAKEQDYFTALRSGATTMTLLDLDGTPVKRS